MNALLAAPFRLPDRTLWVARARLFADRVVLTGWSLRGRYRREIALGDVVRAAWWATPSGPNLGLHLGDDTVLAFRLSRGAATWKMELDRLLGHEPLAPADLPPEADARADAA